MKQSIVTDFLRATRLFATILIVKEVHHEVETTEGTYYWPHVRKYFGPPEDFVLQDDNVRKSRRVQELLCARRYLDRSSKSSPGLL